MKKILADIFNNKKMPLDVTHRLKKMPKDIFSVLTSWIEILTPLVQIPEQLENKIFAYSCSQCPHLISIDAQQSANLL